MSIKEIKGMRGNRTVMKMSLPLAHTGWRPHRCMCWAARCRELGQALDILPTLHSSFLLDSRHLFLLSKSEEEREGGEAGKL